jgi:hypothetical protein
MKKIFFISLFLFNSLFASHTIIDNHNSFNKSIINHILSQYKYKLPVFQDETTSLIGVYSHNSNSIILEYYLDFDVLKNNILLYNENSDKPIKDVIKYLWSGPVKKDFKKNKMIRHLNKCNITRNGKSIFSQGLVMYLRYYLNDRFYEEIIFNENICK